MSVISFILGTWSSILISDMNGKLLHKFKYEQDGKVIELDSFAVLPNNEVCTQGNINKTAGS